MAAKRKALIPRSAQVLAAIGWDCYMRRDTSGANVAFSSRTLAPRVKKKRRHSGSQAKG